MQHRSVGAEVRANQLQGVLQRAGTIRSDVHGVSFRRELIVQFVSEVGLWLSLSTPVRMDGTPLSVRSLALMTLRPVGVRDDAHGFHPGVACDFVVTQYMQIAADCDAVICFRPGRICGLTRSTAG